LIYLFYPSCGFPKDFSGYVISGLSIFVGLFFTFLLTLYSKFKEMRSANIQDFLEQGLKAFYFYGFVTPSIFEKKKR